MPALEAHIGQLIPQTSLAVTTRVSQNKYHLCGATKCFTACIAMLTHYVNQRAHTCHNDLGWGLDPQEHIK